MLLEMAEAVAIALVAWLSQVALTSLYRRHREGLIHCWHMIRWTYLQPDKQRRGVEEMCWYVRQYPEVLERL